MTHPVSEMFTRYLDEGIHPLIDEAEEEIEFSELKCKEIYQLRQCYNQLEKNYKKDEEKKVGKVLTRLFEEYMREQKLISYPSKSRYGLRN